LKRGNDSDKFFRYRLMLDDFMDFEGLLTRSFPKSQDYHAINDLGSKYRVRERKSLPNLDHIASSQLITWDIYYHSAPSHFHLQSTLSMGEHSSSLTQSSPYDRASLLFVTALFGIGTLLSLSRFFPLSLRRPPTPIYPDFEQAPDDDGVENWGLDADGGEN
jgi:hypothetical protein